MDRYEYYTYIYDTSGLMGGKVEAKDLEDTFNSLGNKGWELASSVATNQGNGYTRSIVFIFKRKLTAE